MSSGSDFNIITGEVLAYKDTRRFRSMEALAKVQKASQNRVAKIRLPSLGSPKDKKAFQYSYLDPPSNPEHPAPLLTPCQKSTTMNYTYQPQDPITHRSLNPNSIQLQHRDFTHQLPLANVKGILTQHIDKARAYAPNFHQGFEGRVREREFYRKREVCGEILGIEKSYGLNKYFRKFK